MKTQSVEFPIIEGYENSLDLGWLSRPYNLLCHAARGALSALPGMALVITAAWISAHPAWVIYLQAAVFTSGFVFLGLALEARTAGLALTSLLTGLALFGLPLSSRVYGTEWLILASAVIAAWLSAALFSAAKWPTSAPRSAGS